MMNYFDLTVYQRTLLMTALFVTASFSIIALVLIIKKRQILSKILLVVGSLISGTLCIFYATEARTVKFSRELPETVKKVCEMPILISILLLVLCILITCLLCARKRQKRKSHSGSMCRPVRLAIIRVFQTKRICTGL